MNRAMNKATKDLRPLPAAFALLVLWIVVSAIAVGLSGHRIANVIFPDPDDALRLVQVRDWLAGQSWFDVTQFRINPPRGTLMHWSRLVDLPIGLSIVFFRLFDTGLAETLALVAVPLLTHLVLFIAVYALAFSLTGRRVTALYAVFIMSFTVSVLVGQFVPMRIDHHAWQAALLVIAVMLLFRAPQTVAAAAVAGLAASMATVISIESLPMTVALAGLLALRCLRTSFLANQLIAYLGALALGCAALQLATMGLSRAEAVWCDAMSPAYLAPIAAAALLLLVTRPLLVKSSIWRPVILFGLAPAVAVLAFLTFGPECLAGPFEKLDPVLRAQWYNREFEGLPAWRLSAATLLASLIPVALGLAGSLLAIRFDARERSQAWIDMVVVLAAATLVALLLYRAFGLALALAAPGNAWLLLAAFDKAMERRTAAARLWLGLCCILLMPWIGLVPAIAGLGTGGNQNTNFLQGAVCSTPQELALLNALPRAVLFTPIDMGPDILARTPHSVIATSHHRNPDGIRAVLAGYTAAPGEAEKVIQASGARYLVFCSGMGEMRAYAQAGPQSLASSLDAGRIPAWLHPVLDTPNHLRVYEITQQGSAQP